MSYSRAIEHLTIENYIITARKRSLGQGNIFTPVCHSVHRGGTCVVAPGGMHGCSRGWACVAAPGGVCVVALGGRAWLLWGACMVTLGGVYMVAPGGHAWLLRGGVHGCLGAARGCWGGVHGCSRGVCVGYDEIWRYDQWAGSTHPTRMHSCCVEKLQTYYCIIKLYLTTSISCDDSKHEFQMGHVVMCVFVTGTAHNLYVSI